MQTNDGTKGKLGLRRAQICFELRLKSITVEFNFFGECFLYDSPLLLVEHFLIWPPVGAIFRFRCDTEGAIKRNVKLRENFTQLRKQVFKANNSIDDDFAPRTIQVPEIVNGKSPASEILVQREPAAFARGVHVVMRQKFVPRISFYTKFEVAVPDIHGNALLHLARRHVIIKFRAARHCVAQRGEKLAWSLEDFGNRINQALVVTRLMSLNTWHNRRHDVLRTTMFGQKHFDARARGLGGFDEDEFVFVGQDHRTWANAVTLIATVLLRPLEECLEARMASQLIKHSID